MGFVALALTMLDLFPCVAMDRHERESTLVAPRWHMLPCSFAANTPVQITREIMALDELESTIKSGLSDTNLRRLGVGVFDGLLLLERRLCVSDKQLSCLACILWCELKCSY